MQSTTKPTVFQLRKVGIVWGNYFPKLRQPVTSFYKCPKTCDLFSLFPGRFTPLCGIFISTPIASSSQRQLDTQPALLYSLRHPDREGFRTRNSRDKTRRVPANLALVPPIGSAFFSVDTACSSTLLTSSVFVIDADGCRSRCIMESARMCFLRRRSE